MRSGCHRAATFAVFVVVGAACERAGDETPPAAAPAPAAPGEVVVDEPEPRPSLALTGLQWLRSHQSADGSWDGDVGTTGLALLAFCGAGETHQSGSFRENVKNGLRFLRDRQDADGCFAPRTSATCAVDHALAALAFNEAYGMTGNKPLAEPARRALAFALATRVPGGGWHRPKEAGGGLDVEATGWSATLVKSSLLSDVGEKDANKAALAEAVADLSRTVDPASGRAAAEPSGLSTAMVLLARIFAGHTPKTDDLLRKMADALLAEPAACDTATDVERTYFATMAIYQFGGRRWVKWNAPMSELLRARHRPDPGDGDSGSWDATGDGTAAGRIRTTALCCLTLEVYFRIGDMEGYRREADRWNE